MGALAVTAAEVINNTASTPLANAGETISAAGKSVYLKSSTGKWMLAKCSGTPEEAGNNVRFGVSLHAALADQPLAVQETGILIIGASAAPTVGVVYCIGAAFGAIVPQSDLVNPNKITRLGDGASSSTIDMSSKKYTGLTVP